MLLRACSPRSLQGAGHPPTREKVQVGNLQSGARCELGRTVPGLGVNSVLALPAALFLALPACAASCAACSVIGT